MLQLTKAELFYRQEDLSFSISGSRVQFSFGFTPYISFNDLLHEFTDIKILQDLIFRLPCYHLNASDNSLFDFVFLCRTTSSMTGNYWLYYSYATFQIYSRNAVDGTPVQYGDVVGLKYPYSSYSAWLYYNSYFYPYSCSSYSKTSCAKENTNTGFKIFKKL